MTSKAPVAVRDFEAIANEYARSVVAGQVVACKWVRLACQRHLRDLERAAAGGWQYTFNPQLFTATGKAYRPAQRVCAFAELMPHIKGDWAGRGERIKLEPWQVFVLSCIFGWINTATGKRRFRQADLFVPRKNAKSTIAAVVGLYMLAADGEFGAEVYSGATSQKQAMEVFRPAQLMARHSQDFRRVFGVLVNSSNLAVLDTNSKFEPVIGKPGDGASPSCAIVDEYHEHTSSELYDTMKTGMGARSQPLLLMITTAGNNIGGPCYDHQVELQKILEGTLANETRFGIIFGIDAGDDWTDPKALVKANPNYGVSIVAETLLADQVEAIQDPRKQSIFKTKHLDVWVNSASPWLNLENLQAGADTSMKPEDFRGEACHVGLDLASKNDIASAAWVFRRMLDEQWHYYLFTRNYLPEAQVVKPGNGHYQAWVLEGHLVQTPGNMINLRQIQEDVEASAELHDVQEIPMDAWGSREIAPSLQDQGYIVIDTPMNVRHLSEPMKLISALVDAGRFHHDGNKATMWMLSNVEVVEDRNENVFPRKGSAEKKIDAAVATILAVGRSMLGAAEPDGPGFWDLNNLPEDEAQGAHA
jgi:phage terminase large subunit-like protein